MKAFYLVVMICFFLGVCSLSYAGQPDKTIQPAIIENGWIAFEGAGIRLIYPKMWFKEDLPIKSAVFFVRNDNYDVNMNITRSHIDGFRDSKTLEDVDKAIWNFQRGLYEATGHIDKVKYETHENIEVGGQSATKGVYTAPVIKNPSENVRKMIILVMSGSEVYQIVVNASSVNAMNRPEINEIINSIQFLK